MQGKGHTQGKQLRVCDGTDGSDEGGLDKDGNPDLVGSLSIQVVGEKGSYASLEGNRHPSPCVLVQKDLVGLCPSSDGCKVKLPMVDTALWGSSATGVGRALEEPSGALGGFGSNGVVVADGNDSIENGSMEGATEGFVVADLVLDSNFLRGFLRIWRPYGSILLARRLLILRRMKTSLFLLLLEMTQMMRMCSS